MADTKPTPRRIRRAKSRISPNSFFYSKIIPALLIGMAVLTAVFIAIAAGVLLGLVPYR